MKVLTFLLAGPLASYGECSRWDRRDTLDMPTKSAVIGLLGCCMGVRRGDSRLHELDVALRMGVRRESCEGILTDFQTVTGPNGILNAQGKIRGSGNTIITPKQYLLDSAFQVFLSGEECLLEACERAMRHPKWIICLGRRGAVPSRPVIPYLIDADSLETAVREWQDPVLSADKDWNMKDRWMRCELETCGVEEKPEGAYTIEGRSDAIVRADENIYDEREIRVFTVRRNAACS